MILSYLKSCSGIDCVIFVCGIVLLAIQLSAILKMFYKEHSPVQAKKDLDNYSAFFDFFPLMGMCGTGLGLLNTFSQFKTEEVTLNMKFLVSQLAPAMTSTVTGILCLFINMVIYILAVQHLKRKYPGVN